MTAALTSASTAKGLVNGRTVDEARTVRGQSADESRSIPLVVDLDGTLTPTDTLLEAVIQLVKASPLYLFWLPLWLLRGKAGFKAALARHSAIAAEHLPYRESLLEYLRGEKQNGRKLILATAANEDIARGVAAHLGVFDEVLASDADRNLKGVAKLAAIRQRLGADFVYAGDSRADIPIWKAAKGAILVGVRGDTAADVRREVPVEREFPHDPVALAVWLRALRVHQWLKNLLLFVPALTAFSFTDVSQFPIMMVSFMAFSLAASATYVANDLWDLENDRAHPRKRFRPFASAQIPILRGIAVAACALVLALFLAFKVSGTFLGILLAYLILTSAYSLWLKSHVLVDVLTLSFLYAMRILAGAVAVNVELSAWLLAFSVFIFFSLALVKRCSELVSAEQTGGQTSQGRDYRVTDLVVLWPLGVGAALASVVVFGIFISIPETQVRYATPQLLWLVAVGLIYWLARLWIKTSRGEMHDDPLIYALRDHGSRTAILAMIALTIVAHFISLSTFTI